LPLAKHELPIQIKISDILSHLIFRHGDRREYITSHELF